LESRSDEQNDDGKVALGIAEEEAKIESKDEKVGDKEDKNEMMVLQNELAVRRQQVSAYMIMENGYAAELFASITLSNDLMVTCKDMLKNMNGNSVMRQMYAQKVAFLEQSVTQKQAKWSALVADYQSRTGFNDVKEVKKESSPSLESISENEVSDASPEEESTKKEKVENGKVDLYMDADIREFNVFHADNMDEVNGQYVDVYDWDGNKTKNKQLETKKEDVVAEGDEDTKEIEKFNKSVPKVGGFLAGEELFERQANKKGFEEEIIVFD